MPEDIVICKNDLIHSYHSRYYLLSQLTSLSQVRLGPILKIHAGMLFTCTSAIHQEVGGLQDSELFV